MIRRWPAEELRWNVRVQARRTIACNASNTVLVRWIWADKEAFDRAYPYVADVLKGWRG